MLLSNVPIYISPETASERFFLIWQSLHSFVKEFQHEHTCCYAPGKRYFYNIYNHDNTISLFQESAIKILSLYNTHLNYFVWVYTFLS